MREIIDRSNWFPQQVTSWSLQVGLPIKASLTGRLDCNTSYHLPTISLMAPNIFLSHEGTVMTCQCMSLTGLPIFGRLPHCQGQSQDMESSHLNGVLAQTPGISLSVVFLGKMLPCVLQSTPIR